jgi:hypothetical protein
LSCSLVAAGCAGRAAAPTAAKGPAAAAIPSSTTTTPTPAPPAGVALGERGSDFDAIARALDAEHGRLLAHDPDPSLASTIYQPGTRSYLDFTRNLAALRARRQTLVSVGEHCSYAVASVRPTLVTLRVHEAIGEDRVLDAHGRVVAVTRVVRPNDYVVVLTRGSGARWRLADVTQVPA